MTGSIGIMREGRVEFDAPAPFADGTEVRVLPTQVDENDDEFQHPWPTTPEGIEEMIAALRAIEPAVLTPEEEVAIERHRAAEKAYSIEKQRRQLEAIS